MRLWFDLSCTGAGKGKVCSLHLLFLLELPAPVGLLRALSKEKPVPSWAAPCPWATEPQTHPRP